jgi:DNA polymerase (family 10)
MNVTETNTRFPAMIALGVARRIVEELKSVSLRIEIAGSLRRGKPAVHDVDIVLLPQRPSDQLVLGGEMPLDQILRRLVARGSLTEVRGKEKIKCFMAVKTGIPVDLYIASPETWTTLLLIRTGSKEHNIKLAQRARQLAMKLRASGDGIEDASGQLLRVSTEEELFSLLQVPYIPPEDRN